MGTNKMSDGKFIFEVCCGSADDAEQAYLGGAGRIELNSSLLQGGLTPSLGALIEAKKRVPLPIMCMVRPREGGFCYTECEYAVMLRDARFLLDHGADGIVFGFLHEDGTVDERRCGEMLSVIGDRQSVYSRAIDVVPDVFGALDTLIGLGVTRVLTSGQAPVLTEGVEMIKRMIAHAGGQIKILPGGVQLYNAAWCKKMLGVDELHGMAHKQAFDRSTSGNPAVFFGGAVYPPEDRYLIADPSQIAGFMKVLNQ